jgi:CheY-like chemotaxis protein
MTNAVSLKHSVDKTKNGVRKKILIVDDEPSVVDLVSSVLKGSGWEVLTACNGGEGLQKAKDEYPDLIILDIHMPGMDGSSMAAAVRQKIGKNIPIIFLTGLVQEGEIGRADPKNLYRIVLAKPFKPLELLSLVGRVLNRCEKKSEIKIGDDFFS